MLFVVSGPEDDRSILSWGASFVFSIYRFMHGDLWSAVWLGRCDVQTVVDRNKIGYPGRLQSQGAYP